MKVNEVNLQVGDTAFIYYHPREKYLFWELGKVMDINDQEVLIEGINSQKNNLLRTYFDKVEVVQRANEQVSSIVEKFYSYVGLDFLNEKPYSYVEKLREIYLGLKHGIDVDAFVKPEYSADQMKTIRLELEKDLSFDNQESEYQAQDEWEHEL